MASDSFKCTISLLLLALAIHCGTSVRILVEEVPAVPAIAPEAPDDSDETPIPTVTPAATSPAVAIPAVPAIAPEAPDDSDEDPVPTVTPVATSPAVPAVAPEAPDDSDETPVAPGTPVTTAPVVATGVAPGGASPDHPLTFFMHDILGGSNPSALAVTGIVNNPAVNGQVPFAKPNGANLPVNNGVPVNNANSGLINNNNVPFLTGLSGTTPNVMQNNGNGNNNANVPVLNGGQLRSGNALQKLMFGTMTVFDDELTEGHELGSGLVGKAQGFYVASSEDGNSQTMAFTAMFESGGYVDSLSLFGVHRIGVSQSHLAIMGGTGKYVNAKGFATVKTFPAAINQHDTDGVETLLLITVYLTY